ncbi:MAG TPA: alcohol dehydrogenase family protein [Dongiaceae bacterium]|nr:alcohol dehydrogenase family protein [Dongiaceae bacterium]
MTQLPKTMKAVLMTGYGGFDKLEYREDVAVPVPGRDEVLIRVGAAAINNTDINTRTGWYSKSVREGTTSEAGKAGFAGANAADAGWTGKGHNFPLIQGIDVCGRIVAGGAGLGEARIGQRVLVEPALREPVGWRPYEALYLGSEVDGGFAEYVKVPAVHAHAIGSALSDVELASFPCAYSTAENMIERAGLAAGEAVLVTGASGGVGSAAVQLARRRGAHVSAITSAGKADQVRALGAEQIIDRAIALKDQASDESFDVVIDIAGGPQWPGLLDALKRGGRYAVSGAIAGPIVSLDLRTLYLKDLRLIGCTVLERQVFPNLIGYIERGEIRPVLAATYPLKDIVRAQQDFLAKGFVGKLVLIP